MSGALLTCIRANEISPSDAETAGRVRKFGEVEFFSCLARAPHAGLIFCHCSSCAAADAPTSFLVDVIALVVADAALCGSGGGCGAPRTLRGTRPGFTSGV